MSGLGTRAVIDAVVDHALSIGRFDSVNRHEPKSAPGNGITAAVWLESIGPATGQSGLNATTALMVLSVRLYAPMLQQPYDDIDLNLADAADVLLAAYSGDFELSGNVRDVDLLGASGTPLSGRAGYINQSGTVYRVFTVTLPLIISDAWGQTA